MSSTTRRSAPRRPTATSTRSPRPSSASWRRRAGTGGHEVAVAAAQGVMCAFVCVLVFAIPARLATGRVALGAALLTALFPPIPYYGALVLTEVFTTLLVTAGLWTALRAIQDGGR